MTPYIARTPSESAARLAHLTGLVLDQRLAQVIPWRATEALLAVARQDPGTDQAAARDLVRAALCAVVTPEVIALREGRP